MNGNFNFHLVLSYFFYERKDTQDKAGMKNRKISFFGLVDALNVKKNTQ